ncbi:Retrovirus-related Pol polyprotein from transposon 17.6, partial [Mucuna pruriens]
MAEEDKEKTTFITTWGTFYYRVMSFGLKNAGATYQRAMVTLFHDMMHKEVEFYMDNMIAKLASGAPEEALQEIAKISAQVEPDKVHFRGQNMKITGLYNQPEGNRIGPG